jgi:hypothetical protein
MIYRNVPAVLAILAVFVPLLIALISIAVVLYADRHPCSHAGCDGAAWWRVFVIVRASGGERPRVLVRLATPFRVCGACFADLDPQTALPDKSLRRQVARTAEKMHGEAPDWRRTRLDREHVLAAWLRRGGR